MAKECIVRLKSSDNDIFEVDAAVACKSETIKNLIEEIGADNIIPLLNVTSKILAKVIEYCNYQVETEAKTVISWEDAKKWEEEFVKVDMSTLFDLFQAANYLNIKNLLRFVCQAVGDIIKRKTPADIRKVFDIKNDVTAEEGG